MEATFHWGTGSYSGLLTVCGHRSSSGATVRSKTRQKAGGVSARPCLSACLPTIYQISSSRNKPLPVRWLDDWSLAALSLSHQHRHTHTLITTLLLLLLLLLWSHGFWGATPKEESSVCLGSVPLRTILLAAMCVALPSVQCCSRLGGDHLDHFLPF